MRVIICLNIFTAIALAIGAKEPRQAESTPPPSPFSDNAAQLISAYIPDSIKSLLYSHYTSVESTTGDPLSAIESAFTALTPPAWLDALPTEYQSNIEALESAVSSLRVAATGGAGVSVIQPANSASASTEMSASATDQSESTLSSTSATNSGDEKQTSAPPPARETPSFTWGPSKPGSSAASTRVPIAVAGVLGLIGAIMVL
ncbi:hypothetical protein BDV95DRAFT_92279 [Massariosphaeria phaeospora]|uniref:Uncharacterized protein n=1 Tax=Massariosphaeria phaeospora TaxID=100035 RepID=A0A7C8I3J7_9PLEO|nr:hypothetical protein BDV95DRAFT_92279 [Massariosphaeria phaeospora]